MSLARRFFLVVMLTALTGLFFSPWSLHAKTIEELRADLESKRQELKQAEARITKFKEDIQLKKREARTLQEQIGLIEDTINEIELELNKTVKQIEEVGSEIDSVKADIAQREEEIAAQKVRLADYIRTLHTLDQQSTITIFLKYTTLSEAVNESSTIVELDRRTRETLAAIQQLRDELTTKKRELEDFKQTLNSLKTRQEKQQNTLNTERSSKARVLELTNAQEKQFQDLLHQSQAAHQAANAEISKLDTLIRAELEKQGIGKLPSVGRFSWPVEPVFGISCGFHCAGDPYAYLIGPHSGIDIPTNVGTPIKAPADGYVAKLHDADGAGYSYILMLHGDHISTVYGHVSGFAVNEGQLITRGTVIGYTGGAPGTHGSGLSSGPHLHFEVRINNVPVDPEKYI